MTAYLQNKTDVRMTITASLFGHQLAKKYPFIEPGHAIPVEQELANKVFETNKTWAAWKDSELVAIVEDDKPTTNIIETEKKAAPDDLNPEQDGGKLDTALDTEKPAPKSRKK